ncbi:MAG TPA: hypothetical protein VFV17_08900 [Usitatibacteraceae bacterium]|nr:hypothetical protein [Usitatibacteraceae bacterium]
MGLLDDIKKEADSLRNQEAERSQALKANAASVDRALRKTFQYMFELFKQLNVVKPACPMSYELHTVGKIDGLSQSDYRIEYRTSQRENREHFENLSITFKRGKPDVLSVKREAETIERFRDLLWQNNLRFTSEVFRNERRVVTSEVFKISCEILCGAEIIGDYDNGVIRFKLKNVEDFGPTMYTLEPDVVNDQSLEDLARLFIGKDSNFKSYNRRPTANLSATGQIKRPDLKNPQYAVLPEKAPEEEPKKAGLFGSIKSAFGGDKK